MALSPVGLRYIATGIRPFLASITAARRNMLGLSSSGQGLSTSLSSIGRQAQVAGLGLTFMATVPIATSLFGAVKAASSFEDELIKLNTLSGLTQKEIDGIRQGILSLAPALGQVPTELAEAAFFITSTGDLRNAAKALEVLEVSAKASAIGLGETKVVAGAITSVLAAYGQENVSAAETADILTAAVDRGKFEAEQFAPAIGRVLGLAAELGVGFGEASNFIATYTLSGVTAAQATTSLQRVLVSIQKPTQAARDALAEVGLSLDQIQQSVRERGLTATLIAMREEFDAAGISLGEFFTRVTGLTGVLFNTGEAADLFVANLQAINASAGIVERGFATVSQSTSFQVDQLKASFGVLGTTIGSVLLPAINSALGRIIPFVIALSDFAAQNPRLVLIATGFALITAAIGPLLLAFGFLASAFGGVGGLLRTFGALLLGPIAGLHRLGITMFGIIPAVRALAAGFVLVRSAGFAATIGSIIPAILGLGASFLTVVVPIGIALAAIVGFGVIVAAVINTQAKRADKSFADFAKAALEWGKNIVISLARGIITAAIYVVRALNQLGQVIASWLAPGSPPRLLPDLPEWGESAMNEWLQGFTAADFSVFGTLSSRIEQFMRALAPTDSVELVPSIIGIREILAQAITDVNQLAVVNDATVRAIVAGYGIAAGAAQDYIVTMLRLAEAQEDVKEIQEEINRVNAEFDANIAPLNEELEAIQDRRDAIEDQMRIDELESILADPNAPELARELALMELREIELQNQVDAQEDARDAALEALQAELAAAEAEAAALEERAAQQEALLAAQEKQNELIQEQIELLKRLAEEIENVGDAGGGGPDIGDIPSLTGGDLIGEEIPGLDDLLGEGFTSLAADIKASLEDLFAEIDAELGPLIDELELEFNSLGETWSGVLLQAATNFNNFVADFETTKVNLGIKLQFIRDAWEFTWGIAAVTTSTALEQISNSITTRLNLAAAVIGIWFNSLVTTFSTKWNEARDRTVAALEQISSSISTRLNTAAAIISLWFTTLIANAKSRWEEFKANVATVFDSIATTVNTKLGIVLGLVKSKIQEVIGAVTGKVGAFIAAGASIIDGLKQGVINKARDLVNAVSQAVLDAIAAALGILNSRSPSKVFMKIGEDTMTGMAMGILDKAAAVAEAMRLAIAPAIPEPSVAAPSVALPARVAAAQAGNSQSNTFGPNYINNGMDEAVFAEKVRRVVTGDL